MILTSGERAVWAAAFVADYKECEQRIRNRRRGSNAGPETADELEAGIMECYRSAVEEAGLTVRGLRKRQRAFVAWWNDNDSDVVQMLRAMLGEEAAP